MLIGMRRVLRPLLALPRYAKSTFVVFTDMCFCVLTVWLAFFLRLGEFVSLSENLLWAVIVSIALAFPIFLIFNLYRTIFRYSGWPTILALSRALIIYFLIYATIIFAIVIKIVK